MNDWIKIHQTPMAHMAELIKDQLLDLDIPAVVINKRDSSYNNFGNYEIFVTVSDKEAALTFLHEQISFQ